MPARRPERDKARELWVESKGKKTIREIAAELGVSEALVRKWKSQDKWVLKKPRGAPKGNKNAKNHKGPSVKTGQGNRNAETHGAYAAPDESTFTPEQREVVDAIHDKLLRDLVRKYYDLENRITAIQADYREKYITGGIDGSQIVEYWDSKDKWIETLEQRSLKILSRIQKFMDQQQAAESLKVHAELTRESLELKRQTALGVFEVEEEEKPEE